MKISPLFLIGALLAVWGARSAEVAPTADELAARALWRQIDAIPDSPGVFRFDADAPRSVAVKATPGDYVPVYLALQTLEEAQSLRVSVTGFGNGCSVELLENMPEPIPKNQCSPWLLRAPQWQACDPAGTRRFFTILIRVDENCPAGRHKGEVRLQSATGSVVLPLVVGVEAFALPPLNDDAGFYLPGHTRRASVGNYVNYGTEGYTREALRAYFDFWRSRRLNSPVLYHNYPELTWQDGRIEADFSEMSFFSRTMREAGLNGHLVLELRHITWFCRSVARALAEGRDPEGMGGAEGEGGTDYSPVAQELFAGVLRQLLETAEREQWPPLLIMTEEEVNNDASKLAGYESFVTVLHEVCHDKMLLVDNAVGYGDATAVDRGKRDRVPFRQYNSWTPEALADARADQSTVLSFNYGATRAAFGFSQLRLGAVGHHQWADQWGEAGTMNWNFIRIEGGRVISSNVAENIHAGRLDLAAGRMLQTSITALEAAGHAAAALRARATLEGILADIPVNGMQFRSWEPGLTNRELDLRRWQLFAAIAEARQVLKGVVPERQPTATPPDWSIERIPAGELVRTAPEEAQLALLRANRPMRLDGVGDEEAYGGGSGRFDHLPPRAREIRAKCSSLAEYDAQLPSATRLSAAYDDEALYLLWEMANWDDSGRFRAQTTDNTWEIWGDDAIFAWLQNPENRVLTLLVQNTLGRQTFTRDNERIVDTGIRRAVAERADGGAGVEIAIPWRDFGLTQPPAPGTVWRANFYRSMPTLGEECEWARAEHQFYQQQQWGKLIFTGQPPLGALAAWELPVPVPGRNRVAGAFPLAYGTGQTLELIDAEAGIVARVEGDGGEEFSCVWDIPAGAEGRGIQLRLTDGAGKVCEALPMTVEAAMPGVIVRAAPGAAVSGEELRVMLEIRLPNGESNIALSGRWVPETPGVAAPSEHAPLPLTAAGRYRLTLPTAGLLPGDWRLELRLTSGGDPQSVPLRLLPGYN